MWRRPRLNISHHDSVFALLKFKDFTDKSAFLGARKVTGVWCHFLLPGNISRGSFPAQPWFPPCQNPNPGPRRRQGENRQGRGFVRTQPEIEPKFPHSSHTVCWGILFFTGCFSIHYFLIIFSILMQVSIFRAFIITTEYRYQYPIFMDNFL